MSTLDLLYGSKRNIPMEVSTISGVDFEIDRLEYEVFNRHGETIDEGNQDDPYGFINDKIVYYFLDTNRPFFMKDVTYTICYAAKIKNTPKVVKGSRKVRIVSCY